MMDIGTGHLVTLGLAAIGVIGTWYTLRAKVDAHGEKIAELDKRVDAQGTGLSDLRLLVEMNCVKKTDLERVEDRIGKRLDNIEHVVRNTSATILQRLGARPGRAKADP